MSALKLHAQPHGLAGGSAHAPLLLTTSDRHVVTGVQLVRPGHDARADLAGDLVVDATGRGNRVMTWLTQLGYDRPREDSVKANIAYATRQYVRGRRLPSGSAAVVSSLSPASPYSAVLLPIEGKRWNLTLIGTGKDIPPTDAAGFGASRSTRPSTSPGGRSACSHEDAHACAVPAPRPGR